MDGGHSLFDRAKALFLQFAEPAEADGLQEVVNEP